MRANSFSRREFISTAGKAAFAAAAFIPAENAFASLLPTKKKNYIQWHKRPH